MKKLIIEEMKRLIDLLENEDEVIIGLSISKWNGDYYVNDGRGLKAEIKRKMRELRRDTVNYEKYLYSELHEKLYSDMLKEVKKLNKEVAE